MQLLLLMLRFKNLETQNCTNQTVQKHLQVDNALGSFLLQEAVIEEDVKNETIKHSPESTFYRY